MKEVTEESLATYVDKSGVEVDTAMQIKKSFIPFFNKVKEWKDKSLSIVVTDASEIDKMKQAREGRLYLKNVRVQVEATRVRLKEDSLKKGNTIQKVSNILKEMIVPLESHLEKQEKYVEILQEQRIAEIKDKREKELAPYCSDLSIYSLGKMPEDGYKQLFESLKKAHEKRLEEEKAEAKRLKEEAEERERLRKENEKLQKEKEKHELELKANEEKLKAAKTEVKEVKKESRELKKENVAMGGSSVVKRKKSDKGKLSALASLLQTYPIPSMESDEAKKVATNVKKLLAKTALYIREQTDKL